MEREAEIELARRLVAGEAGAFERFVDHFHAKLFHYSWMMCRQREDAEEVAQETLLKVFENLHNLERPEQIRPWVFRIAKNVCLMKRRLSLFAPVSSQEISLDQLMPTKTQENGEMKLEIADWSRIPEDLASRRELKAALHQAIETLPEAYRSVILLRDVEELSTLETAHILDLTTATVKQRLHRARLSVRKQLDQRLKGAVDGKF